MRSASNSRFAPLQSISSPAASVVNETSRENACSSSLSSACRSALARRARAVERERRGRGRHMRPRPSARSRAARRSRSPAPLSDRAYAPAGRAPPAVSPRYSVAPRSDPRHVRRRIGAFRAEQRYGHRPGRPGLRRQVFDAIGRGGLQGVARAGELKQDRASTSDGGHRMLMQHRQQFAQPVGRRQGLKQAGLPRHAGSVVCAAVSWRKGRLRPLGGPQMAGETGQRTRPNRLIIWTKRPGTMTTMAAAIPMTRTDEELVARFEDRRHRELQPAHQAVGAADFRPCVPHARTRGRRARRHPGDVSARVPRAVRLQGGREVFVLALPHRAESVPRLDAEGAPCAVGGGARGRRGGRPRRRRAGRPKPLKTSRRAPSLAGRSPGPWSICRSSSARQSS